MGSAGRGGGLDRPPPRAVVRFSNPGGNDEPPIGGGIFLNRSNAKLADWPPPPGADRGWGGPPPPDIDRGGGGPPIPDVDRDGGGPPPPGVDRGGGGPPPPGADWGGPWFRPPSNGRAGGGPRVCGSRPPDCNSARKSGPAVPVNIQKCNV